MSRTRSSGETPSRCWISTGSRSLPNRGSRRRRAGERHPAAIVDITLVTNASGTGYLVAYPYGQSQPNTSNMNFTPNSTVTNQVTVGLGSNGGNASLDLYQSASSNQTLYLDVEGYYENSASGGTGYNPVTPTRICDTRSGNPSGLTGGAAQCNNAGKLGSVHSYLTVQVTGNAGVPSGATAVVADLTAINPGMNTYLVAASTCCTAPTATNLNGAG